MLHLTADGKLGGEVLGYPTPGCFGKRGCKRLKGRELGLEQREELERFVRDNTRNGIMPLYVINSKLRSSRA